MSNRLGMRMVNYGVSGWDIDVNKNFQLLDAYATGRLILEAGENFTQSGQPAWMDSDGKIYIANATSRYPAIGMVNRVCSMGEMVLVIHRGRALPYLLGNMTLGAMYYLSTSSGQITDAAPANSQLLGQAMSTVEIWLVGNMVVL
jgi:hypothetical protein